MPSNKPGWWRPRLSIRVLMIVIAILALAFAGSGSICPGSGGASGSMSSSTRNSSASNKMPVLILHAILQGLQPVDRSRTPGHPRRPPLRRRTLARDLGEGRGPPTAGRVLPRAPQIPRRGRLAARGAEFLDRVLRRAVAGTLPTATSGRPSRLWKSWSRPRTGRGPAPRDPGASPDAGPRSRSRRPPAVLGLPHRPGRRVPPRPNSSSSSKTPAIPGRSRSTRGRR